jgi:hypothetical protein
MIQLLRNALFFFLVLLQCITPLTHAHAGADSDSTGIHLPGLEFLINADDPDAMHCSASEHEMQSMVISLGLVTAQNFPLIDSPNDEFTYQLVNATVCVKLYSLNIFPAVTAKQLARHLLSVSSRAPPFT